MVPRLREGSEPATSQSPSMIRPWQTSIHDRRCPSQRGQHGHPRAIDERRPEELERGDQRDQAEEADHFERKAGRTQPRRQRVEDQEVGQARRESERDHDQRGPLGEDAERRTDRAPARRRGCFTAHATDCASDRPPPALLPALPGSNRIVLPQPFERLRQRLLLHGAIAVAGIAARTRTGTCSPFRPALWPCAGWRAPSRACRRFR